jgi:hypothetical protein
LAKYNNRRRATKAEKHDTLPPAARAPTPESLAERRTRRSGYLTEVFSEVIQELAAREVEALRIYRPMPGGQEQFHCSQAPERIIRGSNRAGKTLAAAAEVASALTGIPITGSDGKHIHWDWPASGTLYILGKDGKHLGDPIYKKLFKPGAFRIIRDGSTWRPWLPNDPRDAVRKRESKPAPPLIPKRFVRSHAWENKAQGIPVKITLHNGWVIDFFSANARPARGTDIDLAWADEEVPGWYHELSGRLVDRAGRFIWSATPQTGTDELYELHERAEQEEEDGVSPRTIEEFKVHISDNCYLRDSDKRLFKGKITVHAEAITRWDGDYLAATFKTYPEWDEGVHLCEPFEVPADFCRFAVIDPGFAVCAVLFAAVPPPPDAKNPDPLHGDYLYLYDELYLRNCTAITLAEAMVPKTNEHRFEAFVIDMRGAKLTGIASGTSALQQYEAEFRKRKISSRMTGSGFFPGGDNIRDGVLAVKSLLSARPGDVPKLRVQAGRLPNLCREMKRLKNRREKLADGSYSVKDEPDERNLHLVADLRYLALFRPEYRKPEAHPRRNLVLKYLEQKRERQAGRHGPDRATVVLG